MANFKRLCDLYRFPGFVPRDHLHGLFGDPMVVVVPLRRVRKKRFVASADALMTPITTSAAAAFATSRAVTSGFTSRSYSEGFFALGAAA